MTARAFVVGHPIAHSLSPLIHNAAFAALGIDARYEAVDVSPAQLSAWVTQLRDQRPLGCNVTVPHKETVIPHLDGLRGDAQAATAVNTLAWEDDDGHSSTGPRLVGHNTDTLGFLRSVEEEAGRSLRGARVLLIGAGGAARAIGVVAAREGVASLAIANRDEARAERLAAHLQGLAPSIPMRAMALEADGLTAALEEATMVVNSTSVGLRSEAMPIDPSPIDPGALLVDIVYNPPLTALLRAARARGIQTLGGIGMLTYQAAAAFELWMGAAAPLAAMRQAAEEAIAELQHV
jgi:shikimate dehydrogenase